MENKTNNGELAIFENENFGRIRSTEIDGEAWFVADDIATALGYADPPRAIVEHCKKSIKSTILVINANGHPTPLNQALIKLSDVLRLVMRSRLPRAVEFQDWVVEEVLPAIIKTGKYLTPKAAQEEEKFRHLGSKIELLEKLMEVAKNEGSYRAMVINELILNNTGWDILDEAGQNVLDALGKPEYTPKQIARILGRSTNSIDDALVQMGLQVYGLNQYHLTEKGLKYGYVYDTNRRRNPRYPFQHISNIKWHPIIIDKLRMHFHLDTTKALEQDGNSHFRMLFHMKTDAR